MPQQTAFFEAFTGSELTVENNVLKGVKLAGMESRNGYRYTAEALRNAAEKYEGQPVFLNHGNPQRPTDRDFKDLAGYVRRPAFVEGFGIRGDIDLIENESGRTLKATAEKRGQRAGMSHVVMAQRQPGSPEVTAIEEVISVDAVAYPATASTFYENTGGGTDASNATDGGPRSPQPENKGPAKMSLSEITLESLQKERPDLVDKVLAESKSADELKTLKAQLQESQNELKKLQQAETNRALIESIRDDLKAAGLDPKNEKHVTPLFMESLLNCGDDAAKRKDYIADRAELVKASATYESEPRSKGGSSGSGSSVKLSEAMTMSADDVLAAVRG
ncbi:hypothetical protein GYB59_02060 [bacterium]|nr:hypothetical protein [bacterium]